MLKDYKGVEIPDGFRAVADDELNQIGDLMFATGSGSWVPIPDAIVGTESGPLSLTIRPTGSGNAEIGV